MAQIPTAFNPNDHEPQSGEYERLPDDSYNFIIVDSDVKQSDGKTAIAYKLSVRDGEHRDRVHYEWFNIVHPTEVTQRIGNESLTSVCNAVGFMDLLTDTSMIHGKSFTANLVTKGDYQNMKKIRPLEGATQPINLTSSAPPAPPETGPAMAAGEAAGFDEDVPF